MSVLPTELHAVFGDLEAAGAADEREMGDIFGRFLNSLDSTDKALVKLVEAERFVLTLAIDETGERGPWGIYFRPMFTYSDKEGTRTSHSLATVTPAIIEYWTLRAQEAQHPVLRARYTDAAWEFAKLLDGIRPRIDNARVAIDAYVERAGKSTSVYPTIKFLQRALDLALSIHDLPRLEAVVQQMFDLHMRVSEPGLVGTSVALFDSVFHLRKKVKLSKERLDQIVTSLEHCLEFAAGVTDESKLDHHAAQRYGERLLKHYRSLNSQDNVERVTRLIAGAIEQAAEKAMPILAAAWLNDAYLAYAHAGMNEDAQRLLVKLKVVGRQSKEQLISHVTSQTFTAEQVDGFLQEITAGGLDATVARIVHFFLPKSAKLREQLASYREKFPLMSLFPMALLDDDQVIAHVGSAEQDEEGRLIHEIAQDAQVWSMFLSFSLERLFGEHDLSPEAFVDLLYQTPLFGAERYAILQCGIRHYRDGDCIAAMHVLVPQLEHALRALLGALNRPTNLYNAKLGAYQEKDLGAILDDEAVKAVLGEDITRYLRALLTDQRGWNLRNRLTHGLYASHWFVRQTTDRVIHMLMVLSLIRHAESAKAVHTR